MYITLDLLQKRGACQEALDFFAKHYPDGVEMMYAIEKMHMPRHFLHWGYKHLDPNQEEVAAYWKRVDVVNSQGVNESSHIYNSSLVSQSEKVNDSKEIYSSKEIANSVYVVKSENVDSSNNIGNSHYIEHSKNIMDGNNITSSNQVYLSTYVVGANAVFRSNNIVNSKAIWFSDNLTNCYFCTGSHNLSNAIFCSNLNGEVGKYYLFNKEIDKVRFDMIEKQLQRFYPLIEFMDFTNCNFGELPVVAIDIRKQFNKVSDSFWKWVKTLPGYDINILYAITFNSNLINN